MTSQSFFSPLFNFFALESDCSLCSKGKGWRKCCHNGDHDNQIYSATGNKLMSGKVKEFLIDFFESCVGCWILS